MTLARNVATVGAATMASRLLGFFRDVMIAATFGAGIYADAFFVAFQLPNLARRLLAEGSLNAAMVPLYLRARDEGGEHAAGAYVGQIIGTLALALTVAALVLALAMPVLVLMLAPGFQPGGSRMNAAIDFGRLMLPYVVVAGPLAVIMGVLNANHRFVAAAFAALAFNLTVVAVLAVLLLMRRDAAASGASLAIAVGVAGFAQLLLVTSAVWVGPERVTPLSVSFGKRIRRFVALAVPGLVAGGIPQLTLIAAVMVASTERGAVSWLYYANRMIELPLGIVGIAVGTVLVPAVTHAVRSGNRAELMATESRGLELALGLALPASIALAVLAEPIVQVLFEHGAFSAADSAATAPALGAFALGLPGHVLVKTFSPTFFAREDTGTPMRAALVGFAVALGGSLALLPLLGHVGVAVATAASGWISAAILGALIARRIGFALDANARFRLPRILAASVLMGVSVAAMHMAVAPWIARGAPFVLRIATLALLVAVGLIVYVALLRALKVTRVRDLWSAALARH
jgi:putative peptidoglycan lipid II flippase